VCEREEELLGRVERAQNGPNGRLGSKRVFSFFFYSFSFLPKFYAFKFGISSVMVKFIHEPKIYVHNLLFSSTII
jgi:hypothetical protein